MAPRDALALELWLDRREAALAPELTAHDRAVLAAARVGRDGPPPPAGLLDPALLALPRRIVDVEDRGLVARARTLARWSLAARLAIDVDIRAAAASPRDLDGVTRRQRALVTAACRLGLADAATALTALHGVALARPVVPATTVDEPTATGTAAAVALPEPDRLLAILAAIAAVDPAPITIEPAPRALTLVIAGGAEIHCLVRAGDDALATVVIAAHELGHGLLASARRGPVLTLAAAPSRVVDEAAAAWAVRALEQPAVIAEAAARAAFARRRQRRERLTAALAGFEYACFAGTPAAAAWATVAAVDPRPPARFAALFDEPGVMAAYHAADLLSGADAARPRA